MPRLLARPTEHDTHLMICGYLRTRYPDVIFRTDYASGVKLTRYQAAMNKMLSSSKGYPDLFVAEPRGEYHGLYLELKREGTALRLTRGGARRKPGEWTDERIKQQAVMLLSLCQRGYFADFAIGYDMAVAKIDEYLSL